MVLKIKKMGKDEFLIMGSKAEVLEFLRKLEEVER